ncbi:hypothetical protein C8Q78DRAFT_978002 [Trametes maxima]|nr:hypothetical protein C8Q78DRAFT_978002 [Trametes maxima]
MKSFNKPFKRRKTLFSLSTHQRKNVDTAVKALEPNATGVYCVVTRASANMTILEYAHVVAADTQDDVLDKLEWAWDHQYGTFNVDTRRNIHPLDMAVRRYFDRTDGRTHNGWFWCPTDSILMLSMLAAWQKHPRRDPDQLYKNNKEFKYRLVPFPAMRQTWSIRRLAHFVSDFNPQAQAQQYWYPFNDLPAISLHVPYHFVICDTGKKLLSFYKDTQPTHEQLEKDFHVSYPEAVLLAAVLDIYNLWMSAEPSAEWKSTGPINIGGAPEGQGGSGGPSSHGEGGGQGPPDDKSGPPQSGPGLGVGRSGSSDGPAPSPLSPPLEPGDSASCRDLAVDDGDPENGEEAQADGAEDEDEEWEDPEYGEYLEAWAEDVWKATQEARQPPSRAQKAPSVARSWQDTLVDGSANDKVVLSMGSNASGHMEMSV